MKKFVTLICLCLIGALSLSAQENEQIKKLEERLTALESLVGNLSTKIEEVTKQNLAMKANLKLTPTIAQAISSNNIDFRITSVEGNEATGCITIKGAIENLGHKDAVVYFDKIELIDTDGKSYDSGNSDFSKFKIGENDALYKKYSLRSNAPLTVILEFQPQGEPTHIKVLDFTSSLLPKTETFRFKNLPINWK